MEDQVVLTSQHPLLDAHRIDGEPWLPGLAYLDLVYQLGEARGIAFERHALHDLTLYARLPSPMARRSC